MIKKLKRAIAAITAAAAVSVVSLNFSACQKEDKYLNLPDDPVIFWNHNENDYNSDLVGFGTLWDEAKLFSKTPIDLTDVEIKIDGAYYYYYTYLEEAYNYQTDTSEEDKLELFMEYNGVDWNELYTLRNKNTTDYNEVLNDWKNRYAAVANKISFYTYTIKMDTISEENYKKLMSGSEEEFNEAAKNIRDNFASLYESGVIKIQEPETDEVSTLTTATFYIGDKIIKHEIGKYNMCERTDLTREFVHGERYSAYTSFYTYKKDDSAVWYRESDCIMGELLILVSGGEAEEKRNWIDVTFNGITVVDDEYLTIKPIEIKYENNLGVAVSEEWDGNEFTLKARNWTKDDDNNGKGNFGFAVYFYIKSSRPIPSYSNYNVSLNVELSLDGGTGATFMQAFWPRLYATNCEYYAYVADGVDVLARENSGWGYRKIGDWSDHSDLAPKESSKKLWDRFVEKGFRL